MDIEGPGNHYGIFRLFGIFYFWHHFCPYFQIFGGYMYFKALFRRYSTLKMGFQPTISDFLKFILLSAPNEIQIIEGKHLILRFCEQSMHTLNTIVNQPSNVNFF